MLRRFCLCLSLIVFCVVTGSIAAQTPPQRQTETDEYTRYELLAPETASFKIFYDVTATTSGAKYFWNGIRRGSEVSDISVIDLMTGAPLEWKLVDAKTAKEHGLSETGDEGQFIEVRLARPVPDGGQGRIRIIKTYKDAASYKASDDQISYERTLGIKRNSVVLPVGYELIGCNYPSQIQTETDGRVRVSFMNPGPAGVPYKIIGRKLFGKVALGEPYGETVAAAKERESKAGMETREIRNSARVSFNFDERAFQDRDIVYFLGPPGMPAFRLYHDYTETREGVGHYFNVVRAGSKSHNPSAKILDTGETLKVETLTGAELKKRNLDPGEPVSDTTEVVVVSFPPVKKGGSVRIRITETYTDRNRYLLVQDELIWDRSFGRARNTVVLPDGWRVTANSIPAVVSLADDGKIQLRYWNDRPDNIEVFIRARRR